MKNLRRPLFLFASFVIVRQFLLGIYPTLRYPNYDAFWCDLRTMAGIDSVRRSLQNFELPGLDLFKEFGINVIADVWPPFSPLNLFSPFVDSTNLLFISHSLYLFLAILGAFLYLRKLTKDESISMVFAFLFASLPHTIGLQQFSILQQMLFLIPWLLLLLHQIAEGDFPWTLVIVGFVLFAASSDINGMLFFPPVIFCYLGGLRRFRGDSWLKSATYGLGFSALFLLLWSFYLFPLFHQKHEIGLAVKALESLGRTPAQGTMSFFDFFMVNSGRWLVPVEGSAMLLFVPTLVWSAIAWFVFSKQRSTPLSMVRLIVLTAAAVFLAPFLLYNGLLRSLFPGIFAGANGTIRAQINSVPFFLTLAAGVSVSELLKSATRKKLRRWMLFVLCYGLVVFSIYHKEVGRFLYPPPSCIPLLVHPWLGWCLAEVLIVMAMMYSTKRRVWLSAVACLFLSLSYTNYRARATNDWNRATRHSYRLDVFNARKECLDQLMPARYENSNRTFFVGNRYGQSDHAGGFRSVAEPELNTVFGEKNLPVYREFTHPFAGFLISEIGRSKRLSNLSPQLNDHVFESISAMKLMGVRYVVSFGSPITSSHLKPLGACESPMGPENFYYFEKRGQKDLELTKLKVGLAADGPVYAYELKDSYGIAFLRDFIGPSEVTDALEILRAATRSEAELFDESSNGTVAIEREKAQSVSWRVNAKKKTHLVVSYLFQPFWSAFIDDKPAKIEKVYGIFMGVTVDKGDHTVTFRYRNSALVAAIGLMFVVLIVALIRDITYSKSRA